MRLTILLTIAMSNIIKEKNKYNLFESIPIQGIKTILFQMENCVCKIYKKDKENGNGFFSKIFWGEKENGIGFFSKIFWNQKNELLPVLITNNHILNSNDIENDKIIEITINNGEKCKNINIKIDETRKKFTSTKLDVTFIEIKPEIDNINTFLEIDEDVNKEKEILDKIYKEKPIYILHYPNEDNIHISYGLSEGIYDNNIHYFCSAKNDSSGSPILSLTTFKVIGIHNESDDDDINKGIFIKFALDEFNDIIKEEKSLFDLNPFEIFDIDQTILYDFYAKKDNIFERFKELKNQGYCDKKLLLNYFKVFNIDWSIIDMSSYGFENKNNWFILNKDTFNIKIKDHFYYVIMNDLEKLKNLYEQNKYILLEKDTFQRSLLHYSVIGDYYNITEFLLEKGINFDDPDFFTRTPLYYSNGKIYKLLKDYGAKLTTYNTGNRPKGINGITFKDLNKIDILYKDFLEKKLVKEMVLIKVKDQIVGKRFIRKRKEYRGDFDNSEWIKTYHGTKIVSIEHIMLYGLRIFGEPLNGHIPLGETIFDKPNWAKAIFVSPSIFYASKYSEIIYSDGEEWFILIEVKIEPDSFSKYISTINKYDYRNNEPKKIEYRVHIEDRYDYILDCDSKDEGGIDTISLLFVKKNYLENIKDYYDSSIFENTSYIK